MIIGTGSGTDTLIESAVGIATIHPITGIVTAVSFDVADPWAVGTGATVGYGYTVTPTISFSGATAQERATATTTIDADGQVDSISIGIVDMDTIVPHLLQSIHQLLQWRNLEH